MKKIIAIILLGSSKLTILYLKQLLKFWLKSKIVRSKLTILYLKHLKKPNPGGNATF